MHQHTRQNNAYEQREHEPNNVRGGALKDFSDRQHEQETSVEQMDHTGPAGQGKSPVGAVGQINAI